MLGYLHLACGSLPGGCSVFLGFKGGLGVEGDLGHSVAKSECRSLWMDSLMLPQADETNSSKVEF